MLVMVVATMQYIAYHDKQSRMHMANCLGKCSEKFLTLACTVLTMIVIVQKAYSQLCTVTPLRDHDR